MLNILVIVLLILNLFWIYVFIRYRSSWELIEYFLDIDLGGHSDRLDILKRVVNWYDNTQEKYLEFNEEKASVVFTIKTKDLLYYKLTSDFYCDINDLLSKGLVLNADCGTVIRSDSVVSYKHKIVKTPFKVKRKVLVTE